MRRLHLLAWPGWLADVTTCLCGGDATCQLMGMKDLVDRLLPKTEVTAQDVTVTHMAIIREVRERKEDLTAPTSSLRVDGVFTLDSRRREARSFAPSHLLPSSSCPLLLTISWPARWRTSTPRSVVGEPTCSTCCSTCPSASGGLAPTTR